MAYCYLIDIFLPYFQQLKSAKVIRFTRTSVQHDDEGNKINANFEYYMLGLQEELRYFTLENENPSLLIRKAYVDLYDDYISKFRHTLILGNPGIGKSAFLHYVLKRIFDAHDEPPCVLLGSAKNKAYVYYHHGEVEILKDDVPAIFHFLDQEADKSVYYLFDCGTKAAMVPNAEIARKCRKSVVFSSPGRVNYVDYEKSSLSRLDGKKVYMPVWSIDEVLNYCDFYKFSADIAMKNYAIIGGIVRNLFTMDTDGLSRSMKDAVNSEQNKKGMLNIVTLFSASDTDKLCHRVMCLNPRDEDYSKYFVDFVSTVIQHYYVFAMMKESKSQFFSMMESIKDEPDQAVFRGKCFESYAHCVFEDGLILEFDVRSLSDATCTKTLTIKTKSADTFTSDTKHEDLNSDTYYIPESKCFPSVDSFLPPALAFQMTVSKTHPIKSSGIQIVKRILDVKKIDLYFVVPEDIFHHYAKQNIVIKDGSTAKKGYGVTQWALCLPLKNS